MKTIKQTGLVIGAISMVMLLFACGTSTSIVQETQETRGVKKQITQDNEGNYVYCDHDCPLLTAKTPVDQAAQANEMSQYVQQETLRQQSMEPVIQQVLAQTQTEPTSDVSGNPINAPEMVESEVQTAEVSLVSPNTEVNQQDPHYVVFFEHGYSRLNKQAKETIKDAAVAKRQHKLTKYELTGRTDEDGTQKKNERLARVRVERVRDELIKIDSKSIVITSKTQAHQLAALPQPLPEHIKTRQAIPTDVAAQSRRVDVVLK